MHDSALDPSSVLLFFHSLLRWGVLVLVAVAGFAALAGWLRKGPVFNWQRSAAIWAMLLCHLQLVLGAVLYFMRFKAFKRMGPEHERYWQYEHLGLMLLAIALVTAGRLASRKAKTEQGKHLRVALFYLLALALLVATIPWPNTVVGEGRGWL